MVAFLKEKPCKIIEITTSKTGKHGHAKANITGIDIFTGKKNHLVLSKVTLAKIFSGVIRF